MPKTTHPNLPGLSLNLSASRVSPSSFISPSTCECRANPLYRGDTAGRVGRPWTALVFVSNYWRGLALLSALCVAPAFAQAASGDEELVPVAKVQRVYAVSPNVLAVVIHSGERVAGRHFPYTPQPEDQVSSTNKWPGDTQKILTRDEKTEPLFHNGDQLLRFKTERFAPLGVDLAWARAAANFLVTPKAGGAPLAIEKLNVKCKPFSVAWLPNWTFGFPLEITVYLKMAKPLVVGQSYELGFKSELLAPVSFAFDPEKTPSDAVQVSYSGFRPDDPVKFGVLSQWLGDGGGYVYSDSLTFHLLDDATGESVFSGPVALFKAASNLDDSYNSGGGDRRVNIALANVYHLDFSKFRQPGTYRLLVDGVGTSAPFPIAEDAWQRVWRSSVRGIYQQRAGVELGPPTTTFRRPLNFSPKIGKTATLSTARDYAYTVSDLESPDVINNQDEAFKLLIKLDTGVPGPDISGGYHDAGDWDRRIPHLRIADTLFELYELYPKFFAGVKTNIPESANDLPDILDEAVWGLDLFRRLQTADGGIPGWIESADHPRENETSWMDSLPLYISAPNAVASFTYAATATRAARILKPFRPQEAAAWLASAQRAWAFADKQWVKVQDAPDIMNNLRDIRNFAALELYRATGEARWHEAFLATTLLDRDDADINAWAPEREGGPTRQVEAAFAYALIKDLPVDAVVQANARATLLRLADWSLGFGAQTAHGWTKMRPSDNIAWGTLGAPKSDFLARAYYLTGEEKYLAGLVRSTLFMLGMNGDNLSFTTGFGARSPLNVLHMDAILTGQAPPEGLTLYGPADPARWPHWGYKFPEEANAFYPLRTQWPTGEGYLDLGKLDASQAEYTMQETIVDGNYVWGFLAARAAAESGKQ